MGRAYNEMLWEEARALQARAEARRENASAMQEEAGARRGLFATERDTLPPPPQTKVLGPDGRLATESSSFTSPAFATQGEASQPHAGSAQAVSTGEGGGGGGSRTGPRIFLSRHATFAKPEEWVKANGVRIDLKIPNPRNPFAVVNGDFVSVLAWDCTALLGPEAIFIDPDSLRALQPATLSGRSGGGGGTTGSGTPMRRPIINNAGPRQVGTSWVGERADSAALPSGGERLKPVLEEQTAILRELRDQGRRETGSLARRAGGRP